MRNSSPPSRRLRRSLRWLVPVGVVAAAGVPFAQTAMAVVGGTASADAADVTLSSTDPAIDLNGGNPTVVARNFNSDEGVNLPVNVSSGSSSLTSTATLMVVTRNATELEATAAVNNTILTLLGQPILTVASINSEVACPLDGTQEASTFVEDLTIGQDTAVDLLNQQDASGSVLLEDVDGAGTDVTASVDAFTLASRTDGSASGVGLQIAISLEVQPASGPASDVQLGTVLLGNTTCERPTGPDEGGTETPEPGTETPEPGEDDGLAETGAGTTVAIALVAAMLVTGGTSALMWGRRSARR